jgi:hypothetical protein
VIQDKKKAHGLTGEGLKVTFADYSHGFQEPSSPVRKKLRSRASTAKGFAVPNPLFIRIHHAIAGILRMSAAGENIDRARDREVKGGTAIVLTGADFAHLGLTENLEVLMAQVVVR